MRKLVFAFFSVSIVSTCAVIANAQVPRRDIAVAPDHLRRRQKPIEDPNNSPFKFERYERRKPVPLSPRSPMRATIELEVVGAVDGDTLIISNTANQHLRLRLQGIDAPEEGQGYCKDAKVHLAKLALGKQVSVEFDPRGKPDSEGRIIAKVYLDGFDIALEQVKAGFAWYAKEYKKMLSESDRYTYSEAEREAREAGIGLWRDTSPRAPWSFRKQ